VFVAQKLEQKIKPQTWTCFLKHSEIIANGAK
jgi:hypothetical protein